MPDVTGKTKESGVSGEDGEALHRRSPDLHKSLDVQAVVSYLRGAGEKLPNTPKAQLAAYLSFLAGEGRDGLLAKDADGLAWMVETHVVREQDVPESYFDLQRRVLREQGYGEVTLGAPVRRQLIHALQDDQRAALGQWQQCLLEEGYPGWFTYYVWESVTRMGPYRQDGFPKRSRGTVALFPELNREALAQVYELLSGEGKGARKVEGSFARLYGEQMRACGGMSPELRGKVRGSWVRYERSGDEERSRDLALSLQPWGTGWCTAGESTAHMQLAKGDFWVYRTADGSGKHVVPRIAIRMEDGRVAEVRGVGKGQEMEPSMVGIAERKVAGLPGGERYVQIAADMKRMTALEQQLLAEPHARLDSDTLRFLYGIDREIVGFGHGADPRVKELHGLRNPKADLAHLFNTTPRHISLTQDEALSGDIVYHHGDLNLVHIHAAEGLTLPRKIGGSLYLGNLASAEGLTLAQTVGGSLYLGGLASAEGFTFPQRVGGWLDLSSLTSAEGLTLPREIGGNLFLSSLTSAEGLTLPQAIGASLSLSSLTSAEGLNLPQHIGGSLFLNSLTAANGLILPEEVGESVFLDGLLSAEGMTFPERVKESLLLRSLTSADGLTLPQAVGGTVNLSGLTSQDGLILPKEVGHSVVLNSILSAEGITFPEHVGGVLYLQSLCSLSGVPRSYIEAGKVVVKPSLQAEVKRIMTARDRVGLV